MSDTNFLDKGRIVIGVILSLSLLIFLLIVLFNKGILIVGILLIIFQITLGVIIIAGLLWVIGWIIPKFEEFRTEIDKRFDAVQKILASFSFKLGADFLALLSGVLLFLFQEMLSYNKFNKIVVSVFLSTWLFFSSKLISQKGIRSIGIILFVIPFLICPLSLIYFVGWAQVIEFVNTLSSRQIILSVLTILSLLLCFIYSFFRDREVRAIKP